MTTLSLRLLKILSTPVGRANPRASDRKTYIDRWPVHHSERDMPSLINLLDRLDTRSLQEQKKLSVNMVKRELGL